MENMKYILDQGIAQHVTPGLAALAHVDEPNPKTFEYFAGKLGYGLNSLVNEDTIYDLASLTKILSATLLSAVAIDLGKLGIDEKPWPLWPGVSLAHVLNHTAGLVAWVPLYQEAAAKGALCTRRSADIIINTAKHLTPIAPPGKQMLYSDVGFIALGRLLEERLKDRIDVLFADAAHRYFGPNQLQYVCLYERHHHPLLKHVAPTEVSPWLGRALRGQVHDPNCFAMGGLAGHAGLFGTLSDVKKAGLFFLDSLKNNQPGVPSIIRDFARHPGPRPLGFDKPTRLGSTGGRLSSSSVGHLGFTGTSLWVDPLAASRRGAIYILLTNRVHMGPHRKEGIQWLRTAFHRAAAKWI